MGWLDGGFNLIYLTVVRSPIIIHRMRLSLDGASTFCFSIPTEVLHLLSASDNPLWLLERWPQMSVIMLNHLL